MAAIVASDEFYDYLNVQPSWFTRTWRRVVGLLIVWPPFFAFSLFGLAGYVILWLIYGTTDPKPVIPNPKPVKEDAPRVTIIGAGWAGVTAAKHFVLEGFKVTVLEKRDGIGGIWRYTDDPNIVSCTSTTKTTSSSQVSEFNDFPMSEEMGDFPVQEDMLDYLERYRDHFIGAAENCEFVFDCEVDSCRKINNEWVVKCSQGEFKSDFVTVCTGTHETPRTVAKEAHFSNFTGNIRHSGVVKSVDPHGDFEGKRVLVFGGGETASDLVHHLVGVASQISWSIPSGGYFQAVYADNQPADVLASFCTMIYSVLGQIYPLENLTWFDALLCGNFNGHGIEEFRTRCQLDTTFYNKASESLQYIYSGQVQARRKVRSCQGKTVTWEDGATEDFDEIVLCTGYKHTLSFLPEEYHGNEITDWYRYIFSTTDPSLMFIGFARPLLLSIFTLVEQQSVLAVEVMSKRVSLPENLAECAKHDKGVHHRYFKDRNGRLELVQHHHYLMRLAVDSGSAPKFWKLMVSNPVNWVVAVMGPYSGFIFRANEASAVDTVRFYARHYTIQSIFATLGLMWGNHLQVHHTGRFFLDPSKGGHFKRDAYKFRWKPKLHLAQRNSGSESFSVNENAFRE